MGAMPHAAVELDLRPDEWVIVRSQAEILATLDDDGTLEGLPFMPEMLAHCGQRYQVFKRADKTCDTVSWTGLRRMERTVHLKMLRCDGAQHGGCQAGCLLFWKEAWLKRDGGAEGQRDGEMEGQREGTTGSGLVRDQTWLDSTVYRVPPGNGEVCYRCQATEIVKATCPLPWWLPQQYVSDVCRNKVPVKEVARGLAAATYSKVHRLFTGHPFPSVAGSLKRTPSETLDLQPGEWVVVKSKEEILATLDKHGKNRGMTFDAEMLPYCGKTFRVLRRVETIIEESSGRLVRLPGVCIVLEDVVCTSHYRRWCPRSIFPYWREIWLRRAQPHEVPT
jgi:hypothetical protein